MTTRSAALAGLLAGALVLTGCGGGDEPAAGSDRGSASQADAAEADVTFAAGMVPHHAQAVEMADLVLGKAPSAPVAELARKIKAAQQPEIEQLEALLEDLGKESGGHGGHGDTEHAGAMHAGMMSEEQMRELEAATGAEAERLFLTLMIEHHEGAIEAAEAELADGAHEPALTLAKKIRDDQRAEIATMRALLAGS